MTQLLISVKNVEEALIALQEGADIVDLKDPKIGALGALDINTTAQIVQIIQQYSHSNINQQCVLSSATVGENHVNNGALLHEINARASMGVDLIKIAVSDAFNAIDWASEIASSDLKLVAVFFANQSINFDLLHKLKQAGFYGAMLDTSSKQQNLLEVCTRQTLQKFTQICQQDGLKSGLAGSLKAQHIDYLIELRPFYIGFRGGVCEGEARNNALSRTKVLNVKSLLHEHNKFNALAHKSSNLALHS